MEKIEYLNELDELVKKMNSFLNDSDYIVYAKVTTLTLMNLRYEKIAFNKNGFPFLKIVKISLRFPDFISIKRILLSLTISTLRNDKVILKLVFINNFLQSNISWRRFYFTKYINS